MRMVVLGLIPIVKYMYSEFVLICHRFIHQTF